MEIGSEFWLDNSILNKSNRTEYIEKGNELFLMSGRTAIDLAIRILKRNKSIKNVYFPSYCCNSMLQPFIDNNIKIEFYNVSFENGNLIYDIDINKECDIFFAMNYFGFSYYNMDSYIELFKKRNIFVIEDSTHSYFSTRKYNENSDLIVISLRKWLPVISGALLINPDNTLKINEYLTTKRFNESYISLKKQAMLKKNKYIKKIEKNNKEEFLNLFSKAAGVLENDYKEYAIDTESLNILNNMDFVEIAMHRKNNSKIIYDFLNQYCGKDIKYLKNVDFENDCPIFIPVFMEHKKRDEIKNYLVSKNVYCPNHWPIPEKIINNDRIIYGMELSLICDQRYTLEEINNYLKSLIDMKY